MSDSASASSRVRRAYEDFLTGITPPADSVRSLVRDSWVRSVTRGVNPSVSAPGSATASMTAAEFAEYRDAHPITAVRPLVQSLMLDDIADSGVVVALTDQAGRLLWVEGATDARDKAANINFV
ncbi:transcriptional regulator, partial [Streptomyces sp. SID10244]|nr:transcriptional regulator [Streptomyces sp. SID10244]